MPETIVTTASTTANPPAEREMRSIVLPFSGFYNSMWSDGIDREEQQHCAYEADEREDGEQRFAPELRLSEDELQEIMFDVTDYSDAYLAVAREYVDAFGYVAKDRTGIDLELAFEEMTSPKFYNFETDRVFAHVPLDVMQALFNSSAADDNHRTLRATIKARHSSYDGFRSHYDNDLDDWLAKPLGEWDHNELATLLIASLTRLAADDDDAEGDFKWEVYERVAYGEGFYTAWSDAVDWPAYEAKVAEARAEKLAELIADQPEDYVAPPQRCQGTYDLFEGER
jgi:hypothetical protein